MNEVQRSRIRAFVVGWILLNGLGLGAGLAVGLGLAAPVEALVGMMLVTPIILAIAGSVLGAGVAGLTVGALTVGGALKVAAERVRGP